MKKTDKGPPRQASVSTPYGLPALMDAAAALAAQNIFGDVTKTVRALDNYQHPAGVTCWRRFLQHTGWKDPGDRLGLLDFDFRFPHPDTIQGMTITLLVRRIEGGNGEPLLAGQEVVTIRLRFAAELDGSLEVYYSTATTPEWNEWMEKARDWFKAGWTAKHRAGNLAGLSSTLSREETVRRVIALLWEATHLSELMTNLGLDLVLLEEEEDAAEHVSSLEFCASQVHLVSPWLAEELEKRGAVAGIVGGLPLWSRDNRDAPHLERVLQDIAYQSFSQSMKSDLASTEE